MFDAGLTPADILSLITTSLTWVQARLACKIWLIKLSLYWASPSLAVMWCGARKVVRPVFTRQARRGDTTARTRGWSAGISLVCLSSTLIMFLFPPQVWREEKRTSNFSLDCLVSWLSSPLYNCNKVSLWVKLPPVTIRLGQVYLAATKIC